MRRSTCSFGTRVAGSRALSCLRSPRRGPRSGRAWASVPSTSRAWQASCAGVRVAEIRCAASVGKRCGATDRERLPMLQDLSPLRGSCSCTSAILLRAGVVCCASCNAPVGSPAVSRPYSQLDGERPPGRSRESYLARHRRARKAGDHGAWVEGRAHLMTGEAWDRYAPRPAAARKAPGPVPVAIRNLDDDVLRQLGGRSR